jgi:hypothetical protein
MGHLFPPVAFLTWTANRMIHSEIRCARHLTQPASSGQYEVERLSLAFGIPEANLSSLQRLINRPKSRRLDMLVFGMPKT